MPFDHAEFTRDVREIVAQVPEQRTGHDGAVMTKPTPISDEYATELLRVANQILERGTLVWDRKRSTVAYAFIVPVDLRDDLASIVADIEIADEDDE